jgi:hypothetical protein
MHPSWHFYLVHHLLIQNTTRHPSTHPRIHPRIHQRIPLHTIYQVDTPNFISCSRDYHKRHQHSYYFFVINNPIYIFNRLEILSNGLQWSPMVSNGLQWSPMVLISVSGQISWEPRVSYALDMRRAPYIFIFWTSFVGYYDFKCDYHELFLFCKYYVANHPLHILNILKQTIHELLASIFILQVLRGKPPVTYF